MRRRRSRFCLCLARRPSRSTRFPYTTLFRSTAAGGVRRLGVLREVEASHLGLSQHSETDRKSTRLKLQSPVHLVCRLLLEKKKKLGRSRATVSLPRPRSSICSARSSRSTSTL